MRKSISRANSYVSRDELYNPNIHDFENNVEVGASKTPIQKFYAGQSILITGGTGFLGKILIEKLLRSCSDISTIYLLIRAKKSKNPESRLHDMFEIPIFDLLKKEIPDFRKKIVPVIGDCSINGLKLSDNDENLLIQNVSIVFHLAASVNLHQKLSIATTTNINFTRYILDISRRMEKLKSFIHVSTIFANCHLKHNDERFYKYPIGHRTLLSLTSNLSEDVVTKLISNVLSQWPNTYTFTKAIAESLVGDASEDLPIGLFRPAIIVSTAHEPFEGWVDNLYGPMGVTAPIFSGLLRFFHCDPNGTANLMPVDITVNALIVAAWDVFNHPQKRGDKTLVYNCMSMNDAHLTWNEYFNTARVCCKKYPVKNCQWMPTITLIKGRIMYVVCILFTHLLPAILYDAVGICLGIRKRMWTSYKKIHKFTSTTTPFCTNNWTYTNENIHAMWHRLNEEDQHLFNFDMRGFDWPRYLDAHFKGIRTYLLKDDISTLETSRLRWKRLYWMHQMLKIALWFIALWFVWILFIKLIIRPLHLSSIETSSFIV